MGAASPTNPRLGVSFPHDQQREPRERPRRSKLRCDRFVAAAEARAQPGPAQPSESRVRPLLPQSWQSL